MHIIVKPRSAKSKKQPLGVDVRDEATLEELKRSITKSWRLSPHRQRLTLESDQKTVLEEDEKLLKEYGVQEQTVVLLKDLGAQIGWRTMYLIEYFGPLFVHPFFYHYGQQYVYRENYVHSRNQTIVYAMVMLHFLKRELETVFVHRFSKATMPAYRIGLNAGHYWLISGLLLAYPFYGPWNSASAVNGTLRAKDEYIWPLISVWIWAQISNGVCHKILANLRPKGTKKRAIPRGYGFDIVSCPNYMFESIGWLAVAALTQSSAAVFFWGLSTATMYKWAVKRHKTYKKEFGKDYPANRSAMFPGL